jgi:hypothetical protein
MPTFLSRGYEKNSYNLDRSFKSLKINITLKFILQHVRYPLLNKIHAICRRKTSIIQTLSSKRL